MADTKFATDDVLPDNSCHHSYDSLKRNYSLLDPEDKTYSAETQEQDLQIASFPAKSCRDSDQNPGLTLQSHRPTTFVFCAKELRASIIASESTRIICSVSIALVVVFSFIDRPLLGINIVHSKSIVAMRPLYILLVTEFTILIVHVVIERRTRIDQYFPDEEHHPRVLNEGGLNWERAVRVLERGLVAHQIIRAIFIDFSLYVVIVVCVLSLL